MSTFFLKNSRNKNANISTAAWKERWSRNLRAMTMDQGELMPYIQKKV